MNFLYAAGEAGANQPSLLASLLPLIILFAIFYFLVILPQQRQAKKHKEMVESLKKGDKIVTTGGIIAEVVKNEQDFIKAKIADNVEVKIDKAAVARKLDDEKA
ncbi:preprotein translocase subunit YajC [Caminibacter pacificus]|uniref:Sec translocon accessory complex subunit YajC n=1 Tax=Caminibacter pacificus TaxID=1424653 RepID=A0AAJ4RD43_9BACT|nr:preprotein translocase subunit YajC [Caminibacter pacificus]NPA87559.1 preprotein translocase subunit YajC [Campylobacterota bacterium]QCI27594.1 preprotein translocase subunit YajC [Caminibacter pacificus]ROR40228.1 preprotein translocase subunit YajC [Caminibacter pacificus]